MISDEFLRSYHDVDASIVNVLMKPHKEEKQHKQPHHHTTKKGNTITDDSANVRSVTRWLPANFDKEYIVLSVYVIP